MLLHTYFLISLLIKASYSISPRLNETQYGGCNGGILPYPTNWPNAHYYKRYCRTHRGLAVVTDGIASDAALDRTAYILDSMMMNMDNYIPDIMDQVRSEMEAN